MRTPEQQNALDVMNGWAEDLLLNRRTRLKHGRRQAAGELRDAWVVLAAAVDLQESATIPLEAPTVPAVDVWTWPVVGGRQMISVVEGVVQDSAEHANRGGGPAVDLPASDGQELLFLVDVDTRGFDYWFWNGLEGGNMVNFRWRGTRGQWAARYCHMDGPGSMGAGHTGNTDGGAHLHMKLWLNGVEVKPELQPEFVALLEAGTAWAA